MIFKKLLQCILFTLAIYSLQKFCLNQTDHFSLEKIHAYTDYSPPWAETAKQPLPFEEIFSQPFSYLTSGGQCYVFLSADQQYVLKFVIQHLGFIHFLLDKLPLPEYLAKIRSHQKIKRKNKFLRDSFSYALAYEHLPEEAGLLFVHLNQKNPLKIKAKIIDKLHIQHEVDLDTVHFILQKKATLSFSYLWQLVEQKKIEEAKLALESLCHLILKRSQKGIYDEDGKIHRNIGFLHNQAIFIDVGRLRWEEKIKEANMQSTDLIKTMERLKQYLQEISPELKDYLDTLLLKYA